MALVRPALADRAGPTAYPLELGRNARFGEGLSCDLRPIRREDAERLVVFHRRLVGRSTHFRCFQCHHPTLTAGEVERITCAHRDRSTLVAEQEGNLIGVGRSDRIDATTARVTLVVDEDGEHQGIATCLLDELIAVALGRGIATFTAEVAVANTGILDTFWDTALPVVLSYDLGIVSVRFSIEPTLAYLEGRRRRVSIRGGALAALGPDAARLPPPEGQVV